MSTGPKTLLWLTLLTWAMGTPKVVHAQDFRHNAINRSINNSIDSLTGSHLPAVLNHPWGGPLLLIDDSFPAKSKIRAPVIRAFFHFTEPTPKNHR